MLAGGRCGRPSSGQAGQAMVEFALTGLVAFIIFFGIMDFAVLFAGRITGTNAARDAARYAAVHPTAWSNSANPPVDSIQGRLLAGAVPARFVNDDAHITISYVLVGPGAGTDCGQYSATANAFVPQGVYTEATCMIPGKTLIEVHVSYPFTFATPLWSLIGVSHNPITLTGDAAELEEVPPS
ncbi:MAG: TadE family protein [Candidatus Dormibacteraceae bacterium]